MAENNTTASYATVNDVGTMWRSLTSEEQDRCAALLPVITDQLRMEARKAGMDLDQMAREDPAYANVVRSVTVDIAVRYIEQSSSGQSSTLSQESQSALGYSWSGTYVNTGGGISILNKDLKRLGLNRQRYGLVDIYGIEGN